MALTHRTSIDLALVDVVGEAAVVDETGSGSGADGEGDITSRHSFSTNKPARRSTLSGFSAASAEAAGFGVSANVPTARRSSLAIEPLRRGAEHRKDIL